MAQTMRRIAFLEWIRGAAAVLVAVQHVLEKTAPGAFGHLDGELNLGRVGVVAFFLVSGYVIPLSFEHQDVRTFLIRRTFRLFPTYWLCLGIAIVVLAATGELGDHSPLLVAFAIVANLTMLQGLVLLPSLLEPAWTLTIEWVFYFQQIGFKMRGALDRAWVLGYLWILGFVAASGVERILDVDLPATFPLLLGVSCLGHAWARYDAGRMSARAVWTLAAALIVAVPVGSVIGIDADWPADRYTISTWAGLAFFAAFWLVRERWSSAILEWFGGISYALYLSHGLVLYPLTHTSLPAPVVTVACFVLMPLVAHLLHRHLEQPLIERGRALSRRPRAAEPAATA